MFKRVTIILAAAVIFASIPAIAQQAGWLGISVEDQKDKGPIVRNVEPNSPASKAGLKEGDVITQYNKENVAGVQQLTRLIRETPVGRNVEMKVQRDGREQTLQLTTEAAQFPQELGNFQFNMPDLHVLVDRANRARLSLPRVEVSTAFVQAGIRVEQLTDQLRDFFGVFSNNGVLVSSVDAGSAAEKAGLKAGDVITTIDGKTVRTPADFSREMRSSGSKVTLKIMRDKQEREIKLD
jgi:serine protease Do